jgi:ABC-type nitrate/sulfonate/bicarbonate transport system permease component
MTDRRPVLRVQLVTIVVVLALYEGLARSGLLYQGVLPPLGAIALAFAGVVTSGATWTNLGVTALEVAAGFAVATAAGIALGIVIGSRAWLRAALGPYLDGLATAPKIVFFPIAILVFGVGPSSKAALGALSAFFPVVLTVAAAVRRMNPVFVRVGRSFNASPWQMMTKIYLPALVPAVANGMRLGLGLAIIGCLLGEAKLADRGIGFLAIDDYNHYRIPEMYALLLLIFAIAIGANVLIGRLEARRTIGVRRRNG